MERAHHYGCYTGTSMENYFDLKIRTKETKAERIFNTIKKTQMPNSDYGYFSRCGGEITEGTRRSVPRIYFTK